ncbi:LacI family DNA-binding transcriptional regulator [Actinomyces minihominis]|uniref:LacI family DNA-binding transcriptional regulator n=1 Tax=Actinomyces minihominis TaxID=2002838 RepID=UPI0013ED0379|nr:LacI family DNA-binding transcriptional regulator [Actinomyces minihominis]
MPEPIRQLPGPVTLESVGRRAGVSRSTVSRVINGATDVSAETIACVMAAVEELGYIPNYQAKSLASRKASTVSALIPEDVSTFFNDPFIGSLVQGLESYLCQTDLVLNLIVTSQQSYSKVLASLGGGRSDGIFVFSHHGDLRLGEALSARIPVVYGGRPPERIVDADYVDVDNAGATHAAVELLVARGCKRIAHISGPDDMVAANHRLAAFLEVTGASGTRGPIVVGDFSFNSGAAAARELLAAGEPFDGLFAANDLMARAAIDVFLEAGLGVPGDVAVVGFDDSEMAVSSHPYLTTVHQDPVEQGRQMAMLLERRLAEPTLPPQVIYLPTELIVRESA